MVKTVPGQPGGSPAGLRAGRRLAGPQLARRAGARRPVHRAGARRRADPPPSPGALHPGAAISARDRRAGALARHPDRALLVPELRAAAGNGRRGYRLDRRGQLHRDLVRPRVLAVAADQPDLRRGRGAADAADRNAGRLAAQPARPPDGDLRVRRRAAGLGHACGVGQRHLRLAGRPRRRGGGLDAEQAAALAGRRRALGQLQLDQRRAARLHAAHRAPAVAGFPVHRRHRAGRAEDRARRAARVRPRRRRRAVADLLAGHLPAAQADLPGAAAALGHLGLRRVHAGLHRHRRARQPGRVQPGHLRLRPGFLAAAQLRRGVRARVHPHGGPARSSPSATSGHPSNRGRSIDQHAMDQG